MALNWLRPNRHGNPASIPTEEELARLRDSSGEAEASALNWAGAADSSIANATAFVAAAEQHGASADRQKRGRRLLHAVSSAMASKGVVIAANALSIPIAIRYLGGEKFGIWTIISTTLTMLLVLDLGVANSLTNFISEAYARNDRKHASQYSTTALLIMVVVAVLIGVTGTLVFPYLDWYALFKLSARSEVPEVARSVAVAFLIFLIDLPSRLATKILGGYQELRTASLFTTVGGVGNLVAIVVVVKLRGSLAAMVAGASAALVGSDLICLLWLICFSKPWLVPRIEHLNRRAAARMMRQGLEFFIIQIAGLVVFNSDNLVITHYLGPAEVARYSVAWRLVGYAAVLQTLITPALWPAFSEAFDRGDLVWVRAAFRRIMAVTVSVAIVMAIGFALFGRSAIRIWATEAAVPSQTLILLMGLWVVISTYMNNTATVLASRGRTRVQAWCSVAAAALNLALSIWLVQWVGTTGVILGTILSYAAVLIIPQSLETWQVLTLPVQSRTPE
jgi:O-antigen/teichoic acid export membrane protein